MAGLFQRIRDRYINWRYGAVDPAAPVGKRGEQAAARLLRRKGLQVVAESESDKAGEIDRVDHTKQGRVTRAALRYLKRKKLLGTPCRFDVIAVWWPNGCELPERMEHFEAAFEAAGEFQMF